MIDSEKMCQICQGMRAALGWVYAPVGREVTIHTFKTGDTDFSYYTQVYLSSFVSESPCASFFT